MPTLAEYARHAELFGSECVYETAERDLNPSELIQLDRELTRLDTARRKRFQTVPARKRMPKAQKLRAVEFLTREGLPQSRIAAQLGVTVRQVQRLVRELHEAGQGSMDNPPETPPDPTFQP